jgi:hypothetical protein
MDLTTRSDIVGVLLHLLHKHFKRVFRVINEVIKMRILSSVLGRSGFINNLADDGLHIVT